MLNAEKFQIISCQVSVFTPELQFRTSKVLAYLLEKHANKLNADPISLPIPSEAPGEIPRIVLQSTDQGLMLQAGPAILVLTQQGNPIVPESLKAFLEFALSVFIGYLDAMSCQGRRVAILLNRFTPDENGAKDLAAHFCKDSLLADPLNRPSDFEVHAAKQFRFGGWLEISSWFRCKSVNLKIGDSPSAPGIMVMQDFNSALVEHPDAKPLSAEQISTFFRDAPRELQLVVNRYFPSPQSAGAPDALAKLVRGQ